MSSCRIRLFECRCRRRCDSRTRLSSQTLTAGRVDSPASAAAHWTSGTSYCGCCVGDNISYGHGRLELVASLLNASPPVRVFLGRYFSSSVRRSLFWTFSIRPITPQIPTRCAIIALKNGRRPVCNRMYHYKYLVQSSDFILSSS
jgi:hypothetical protein